MARNKLFSLRTLLFLLLCNCFSINCQGLEFGDRNFNPLLCPENTTTANGYTNTSSGYILGSVRQGIVIESYCYNDGSSLYFNTSGSYFLPSLFDGTLSELNALGHLSRRDQVALVNSDVDSTHDVPASKTTVYAYLYGLIFRPNFNTRMYSLYYGPVLMTHQFDFNPIFPNVAVRKGDLIGVLIPEECSDTLPEKDHNTACPSHPNLKVKEGKCSSAFFHPINNIDILPEKIPMEEFEEVFVDLNMEAVVISPSKNGLKVVSITVPIASFLLISTVLIVVAATVANRQKSASYRSGCMCDCQRMKRKPASLSALSYRVAPDHNDTPNSDTGYCTASVSDTCNPAQLFQLSMFDACLFRLKKERMPFKMLEIGEEIGKAGNFTVVESSSIELMSKQRTFGRVFKGFLTQKQGTVIKVAVKTVKNNTGSYAELKQFLDESRLMCRFSHPHVLGLVGICLDNNNSPYLLLPYMENGDLKGFLKNNRTDGLPEDMLLRVCKEIAEGMKYLASRRLVHRDLAARNCMVDEALSIKVGDFGLTRDIYETDYYRLNHTTRLPIKWMAPESMSDRVSDEKTDVWSYGVTCWEAYSMGKTPYPTISNVDMLQHLEQGHRLTQPELCPHSVFSLMKRCWEEHPENRPTFSEIVELLVTAPALQQETRFDTATCSIQVVELSCSPNSD